MADRPILFSAPMIRAILREIAAPGTGKTQTRRVLKRPSDHFHASYTQAEISGLPGHVRWWNGSTEHAGRSVRLPYAPGDRLWVRERWTARMTHGWTIADARSRMYQEEILYKADNHDSIDGWWPSIHMPREFSRLTLHVTDVRVQRLQDISEDDAQAEGCPCQSDDDLCGMEAAGWFRDLWDSLNAERAPWSSNPWVVAITFRPVLGNIDRVAE